MSRHLKQAFNYEIVSHATVYFNEAEDNGFGDFDAATDDDLSYAELNVRSDEELHELVRHNTKWNAYRAYKIYRAEIDGHTLESERIYMTPGKVYFGKARPAEEYPSLKDHFGKGYFLVEPDYLVLDNNDMVFDRQSGECIWPPMQKLWWLPQVPAP